jgi:hypothetical protein
MARVCLVRARRARWRRAAILAQVLAWAGGPLVPAAERPTESLIGEITALDATSRRLTLKADDGHSVEVSVEEGASILKAKPGTRSLKDAVAATLPEIAVADRVLVRGVRAADGASLLAQRLVVMARDDIARKQEAERADWRRRGVVGTVTSLDKATGEITLRVGRALAARSLLVPTAGRAVVFRRYAPDSVKFADAKPSSLAEIEVGDELRALGERSADDNAFLAEQIVFGSFRLVAGAVTAVESARHELAVRDEESGRKVTVSVGPDARLRRLPPEMVARFARRREVGEGAPGPGNASRPERGPAPAGAGARERGEPGTAPRPPWGRGQGGGAEDLLERMPPTTLAEVKVGDRILVSSTKGVDSSHLNAISLVAGLEALSPPPAAGRAARGPDSGLPPELMDMGMSLP